MAIYFGESLGILDRLIWALETSEKKKDATSAWASNVYPLEAAGLIEFLEEELEVHALRKRLAYETVVVTDAGLVGDGKTNNRPAFDRLINSHRRNNRTPAPTASALSRGIHPCVSPQETGLRLVFPAGEYLFADPTCQAAGSLVLEEVQNLLLEGRDGARIITSGAAMAGDSVRIARCRNVILRNLTLDMDPLPFVFGRITAKDEAKTWIEIELLANSLKPDFSYGSSGPVTIRKAGTCHYVREAGNNLAAVHIEPLGTRRYRLHLRNAGMPAIAIGDTAVWHPRGRAGCGQGLHLRHSRHIQIEHLRMRAAETTCVWMEYSGGVQFLHCEFVPPPDRPALVNADAFHVPGNFKGPYLENVTVAGSADDCMNFYTPAFSVADWNADERALTLLVDFPGDLSEFFSAGDPIALMDSHTGDVTAVARIEATRPTPWKQEAPGEDLRYGKRALRLTLDRQVEGIRTREALGRPAWSPYHEYWKRGSKAYEKARSLQTPFEHLVVNLRYLNSGFIIRNSRFGYNRALGFKCKAGCGVIRSCHFIDQAVVFECSLPWREGFLPHDIEVADTRIDRFTLLQLASLTGILRGPEAERLMPRIRFVHQGATETFSCPCLQTTESNHAPIG